MPFVLLLLLGFVCLQNRWPEPPYWLGPWGSIAATFAGIAMFWVAASHRTSYYCDLLARNRAYYQVPSHRPHVQPKMFFSALAAFYVLALYLFGYGWTVKSIWSEFALPGVGLALILPFLGALILSWARFYDLEHSIHDLDRVETSKPFLGRWAYVGLQVRFNFLLIALFLFLMLLQEAVFRVFPDLESDKTFAPVLALVFLVLALVSIPWLLRLFLGLRPLPKGPLRDQLEAAARRVGFRCSDILLWDTRNSMANAMVTGVLPWGRYIVLTDRLICELSTEELEGVLGHEIGHIKHHHMFFYTLFLLGSLLTLGTLWQMFDLLLQRSGLELPALDENPVALELLAGLPPLLVTGLYVYWVFGYLSRFCERQADIFGCRTASCQVFINALEKVAALNGIHREKPGWFASWRHPTIARRVDFLQRMQEDPLLEPRFQRRLGLIKWSVTIGLALVLGVTLWLSEVLKPTPSEVPDQSDARVSTN